MTRPYLSHLAVATPDVSAFRRGRQRGIRIDIDRKYRSGLIRAVGSDGNAQAKRFVHQALDNGPSRGGTAETQLFFGDELALKLDLTASIVDALEIAMPGFKRWLELTGFGNDKTMIRGFVAWAEHKAGVGHVNEGAWKGFDA